MPPCVIWCWLVLLGVTSSNLVLLGVRDWDIGVNSNQRSLLPCATRFFSRGGITATSCYLVCLSVICCWLVLFGVTWCYLASQIEILVLAAIRDSISGTKPPLCKCSGASSHQHHKYIRIILVFYCHMFLRRYILVMINFSSPPLCKCNTF